MSRKGNLSALKKAIKANHSMPPSAKRKALSTIENKIARVRPKSSHPKPRPGNLGLEGFKEAGIATVKLVSHPIDQAVEGYHLFDGIRKMWKAIEKWLNSL